MPKYEYTHMYNNMRWRRLRADQLQREPLCWYCEQAGRLTPADTVDHIIPHRGDEALFWDALNIRSCCRACHDSVAQEKDLHGYARGARLDGEPLDASHPWSQK